MPFLRAAILGCGRIAGLFDRPAKTGGVRTHAGAHWGHKGTRLIAVADPDQVRAQEVSRRWGHPRVYTDARELLTAETPDIVSVCTPDETHAAMLEACLESASVRGVWCEKPLHTDVRKAEALVNAYRERGVVLAVNYQRRWDPRMRRLKRALDSGRLGVIQKVVAHYARGILHNGSHAVDLFLNWFGPAAAIEVFGGHNDSTPDDPTVDARAVFGGVPVYLLGTGGGEYDIFEIQIFGTAGRVDVRNFGREMVWYRRSKSSDLPETRELSPRGAIRRVRHMTAMKHALDEIVHAVLAGGDVASSGASALETLRVCDELRQCWSAGLAKRA